MLSKATSSVTQTVAVKLGEKVLVLMPFEMSIIRNIFTLKAIFYTCSNTCHLVCFLELRALVASVLTMHIRLALNTNQ